VIGAFIILYLLLSVLIGLWAARKVRNEEDFVLAGKRLPMYMSVTLVFATWFGSETILGSTAVFLEEGWVGVAEDPFGAALCLFLVGLFFARPLYRMNLLTFGDFYRNTFGKRAELISGIFLVISYLGWVAAQLVAMAIVLTTIFPALAFFPALIICTLIVTVYTVSGGMWSVSVTDFVQTIVIVIGLIAVAIAATDQAGGWNEVINNLPQQFHTYTPHKSWEAWLSYIAAWMTIGLGSIPQQDVFQRVMSARSEKAAVRSSIWGGAMYLTVAMLPLYIVWCAMKTGGDVLQGEQTLPLYIVHYLSPWIQILFFGALLSAVMSTASGALLAPAVILSENIIQPIMKTRNQKVNALFVTRMSVIVLSLSSLLLALGGSSVFALVRQASEISLVSLFVPLCAGLFLKYKNETGAIWSMISGFVVWFIGSWIDFVIPPMLVGLTVSALTLGLFYLLLPHGNDQIQH
jgi:Na+/proline symporter